MNDEFIKYIWKRMKTRMSMKREYGNRRQFLNWIRKRDRDVGRRGIEQRGKRCKRRYESPNIGEIDVEEGQRKEDRGT